MISRRHRFTANRAAHRLLSVGLALILCFSAFATDAEEQKKPDATAEDQIVFIPPLSGAPVDRLGAGTRDIKDETGPVLLLVPPQGAVSGTAKPLLIWHFSEPVDGKLSILLNPVGGLARGFATSLDGNFREGFHALDLRRSQVELALDTVYRWDITITMAEKDPVTKSAFIEHRVTDEPPDTPQEAAANGLWLDALVFLFDVEFSGQVTLRDAEALQDLAASAGLDLTNIVSAAE